MGRSAKSALTVKQVENWTKLGYTADGKQPGLNLQVAQGANGYVRSWIFRYTSPSSNKRRELGLGATRNVGLAEARQLAAEAQRHVAAGLDPKDVRETEKAQRLLAIKKRLTFEEAAVQCIAARQHEWKNAKHRLQWSATLTTYAYPVLGKMPIDQVTIESVLQVLEPIWITKTETARRLRQRIETVLDWAKARKMREGDNPAALKSGLGQLLPKASKIAQIKHQPALPYQLIHDFTAALQQKKGVSPRALEFLIHTAARSGEVLGAKWDEFDLVSKVWNIPAGRMKAGREHRIPLNTRAVTIIREMMAGKQCDYVFPDPSGQKGMSNGAMLAVIKGMADYRAYVPHGFRSTFRDWASETTNFPNETLELALAHSIRDKTEAAYRRRDQLEKRAKLMELWAQYIAKPSSMADVTVIRKAL